MIAVVTFLPVNPIAHASSTFKSSFGFPLAWPVFLYLILEKNIIS
jgi:hypothetical protein